MRFKLWLLVLISYSHSSSQYNIHVCVLYSIFINGNCSNTRHFASYSECLYNECNISSLFQIKTDGVSHFTYK